MKINTLYGKQEIETKRCITCNEVKSLQEFHIRTKRYNGEPVGNDCKVCKNKKIKQINEIKKTINFSQDTCCELCGRRREDFGHRYKGNPFCVDHEHKTGKLRGILCMDCNTGLSRFNDDIELLKRGINYLKNWNNDGEKTYPNKKSIKDN